MEKQTGLSVTTSPSLGEVMLIGPMVFWHVGVSVGVAVGAGSFFVTGCVTSIIIGFSFWVDVEGAGVFLAVFCRLK
jgi:hypothetical protein